MRAVVVVLSMKTLLVATDFSAAAVNATNYAANLAAFFKARLVLVNAYALPLSGYDVPPALDILGRIEDIALENLKQAKESIQLKFPGLKVDYVSRMGDALAVIDEVAKEQQPDFIVMGIVGNAGLLKEHVVGSTSLDVARDVKFPLIIVPEGTEYSLVDKITFSAGVGEIDGGNLVNRAKQYCSLFNARLEIISIEAPELEKVPQPLAERPYEVVEKNFTQLQHETVVLNADNAANALEDYFAHHKTGMVMVSPKKYGVFKSMLHKSITKQLAFHIHLPLLVVH